MSEDFSRCPSTERDGIRTKPSYLSARCTTPTSEGKKKNLGTLESLRVSLLVITHTFMSEAVLGFEQAWTPILNLTARLCKLLALRDLSAKHGHHQF